MSKYRFSVFTATYNRAKFLPKVYESLVNQTFKDFEWIIIDDGSTDDTELLVKGFIQKNELLSVQYIKKENGGKHTAWREATKLFDSEYVVSIDSDDYLTFEALEIFNKYWKELESSSNYGDFWEVKARAKYESGETIEKPLPCKVFDISAIELSYRYRFFGDLHGCRKLSVLKNEAKVPDSFLFEEQCSNFTESIRWFRASKKYKTRYIEEYTEIVNPYAHDKLTSGRKNKGLRLIYNDIVGAKYHIEDNKKEMFRWYPALYFRTIVFLIYSSMRVKINPFQVISNQTLLDKITLYIYYIPTYILYQLRKQ